MTEETKKYKIKFMPGCFDNFEGTQEELDAFIKDITEGIESGKFIDTSEPVPVISIDQYLDMLDPDEVDKFLESLPDIDGNATKRTLQ